MKKFLAIVGAVFAVSYVAYAATWPATNFSYGWHANRVGQQNSGCNSKVYIHTPDVISPSAKLGNLDNWDCDGDDSTIDLCTAGNGKSYYRCTAKTPDATVHKVLVENTFDGACAAQTGDLGWDNADIKRTSDPVTPVGTGVGNCLDETVVGSFTGDPGFND